MKILGSTLGLHSLHSRDQKSDLAKKKIKKEVFGIFGVLAPRDCEKRQQVGDLRVCTSIFSLETWIWKQLFQNTVSNE